MTTYELMLLVAPSADMTTEKAQKDPFNFLAVMNFYEGLAAYSEEVRRRGPLSFDFSTRDFKMFRTLM